MIGIKTCEDCEEDEERRKAAMKHGPHHNCLMCRMAKKVGMIEKHPENCNCQAKQEQRQEQSKVQLGSNL